MRLNIAQPRDLQRSLHQTSHLNCWKSSHFAQLTAWTIYLGSWIKQFWSAHMFKQASAFSRLWALYYYQQRHFLLLAYACWDECKIPFFRQRWWSFRQYSIHWANTLYGTTTLHAYTIHPNHSSGQCSSSEHYLQQWQTLLNFQSHWFWQGPWLVSHLACTRGFNVLLFFMPC